MAVSIVGTPLGHKLAPELYEAELSNSGGDALITHSSPIEDGSYVYIDSKFERYSGFRYVAAQSSTTFKIRDRPGGSNITYIQSDDISFQISVLEHGWQSVHLPIVYTLESNLFPFNYPEEDITHNTISSFANSNGYVHLTTAIGLADPEALYWIELKGDGPLAGQYQIVAGIDNFNIVINLAYDASYDFSPYYIVKYYNNYFITVNVYSGLESGHRWYDQKPSEIIASIRIIPGDDNRVKFSISELLKGNINTRNNLGLDTLPNNLDFFTQSHIEWFESYDSVSDGEVITFSSSITEDTFVVNAVNSMMPFKSLYQSFMSDYVYASGLTARWLTIQDVPLAIVGYYFDLSFLLRDNIGIDLNIDKKLNGSVINTELVPIENPGSGVIRVPIEIESGYDRYCVKVSSQGINDSLDLESFQNTSTGVDWTLGANPSITLSSDTSSKRLYIAYPFIEDTEYSISVNYNYDSTGLAALSSQTSVRVYSGGVLLQSQSQSPPGSGPGSNTNTMSYTASAGADTVAVNASHGPTSGSFSMTITSVTVQAVGSDIIEEICINIITDACEGTIVDDNLRITEDGIFRELE